MDYREKVKEAIAARDGRPVYNRSLEHAAIIVEEMFALARNEIKLFTGRLNADVYGIPSVIIRAEKFLADADHKVRILIEEQIEEGELRKHPFISSMSRFDNLEVRRLKDGVYDPDFHMMLVDDHSYRFEPDKRQFEAVATFGDEETTGHLNGLFEQLWKVGDVVQLRH